MKKFEFRLGALLRLRDTQLALEKNKLQLMFAERQKLENNLNSIGQERVESEKWIQGMSAPNSADLRSLSAFLLGSKAREATLHQALQACNQDIVAQRQRTMRAERNQKLLLNLKDKQKESWTKDFDKELESIAEEAHRSRSHAAKQASQT